MARKPGKSRNSAVKRKPATKAPARHPKRKPMAKRKSAAKAAAPRAKRRPAAKRKPGPCLPAGRAKAAAPRGKGKPAAKRKSTAKIAARRPKRKSAQKNSPQTGSLRIEDLAELLRVPAETIRSHVADGAPVDRPGKSPQINLVHYAAWLIQRLQRASGKDDA